MRLALLLVLASLSASAAEPKPCAKEEAEYVAAGLAYMREEAALRELACTDCPEKKHEPDKATVERLDAATKALAKCRAGKAVKP